MIKDSRFPLNSRSDFHVQIWFCASFAVLPKKIMGEHCAIMGNIPPMQVVMNETPEMIYKVTQHYLNEAAGNKGLICSLGGGISAGSPVENVDAMVQGWRDWDPKRIQVETDPEVLKYLNDGGQLPQRSSINSAHAYLAAPYGFYQTADGYIALAMGSILTLGELLGCRPLLHYTNPKTWFSQRDEIKQILVEHMQTQSTAHWLSILEPADIWCADVLTWPRLGVITLDRPSANSYEFAFWNDFETVVNTIEADDEIKVALIVSDSKGK